MKLIERLIINITATEYDVGENEITGAKQHSRIADARHMAAYILRENQKWPLVKIGVILGGRTHPTIKQGIEKIAWLIEHDKATRDHYNSIMTIINICNE